jgi:hypothetical protein
VGEPEGHRTGGTSSMAGFSGLDNIGVFDRSKRRCPSGGSDQPGGRDELDGDVLR